MKKLIIPFLLFVQFSLFAQNPQVINVENDETYISSAELHATLLSSEDEVFNSAKDEAIYASEGSSRGNILNTSLGEISEDGELIINNKLLKDPRLKNFNGMLTFTKDGKTVFFSVNRKIKNKKGKDDKEVRTKNAVNLQLFKANVDQYGEWFNLEMLPFNSNHFSTGQPALNEDDTKLYFVSDGPESIGKTDIFVVNLNEDGTYGKPMNMGPKVNTVERDIFPFIDEGNLLYFASDAHNRQGELDVFVCKIFDNTISVPIKLKVPVNMGKENTPTNTDADENGDYFSSNRQVGKGDDDIYAFVASVPVIIECEQEVSGIVKNVDTQELLPDVELVLFDEDEKQLESFQSNKKDATFSFKQSCNTTYTLKGYVDGNLIGELDVETVNDLDSEPMKIVMNMDLSVKPEDNFVSEVEKESKSDHQQKEASNMETLEVASPVEASTKNNEYNFNSDVMVYTVQVGAYRENVQAHSYTHLTNVFNHKYEDGYNRYFSGVFESSLEARKYLELVKEKGHGDAFIVGLNGENRF